MSELRILGHKLSAKEIEYITRIRFSIQNPDINEFRLKNFLTSFSIPNFLVTFLFLEYVLARIPLRGEGINLVTLC